MAIRRLLIRLAIFHNSQCHFFALGSKPEFCDRLHCIIISFYCSPSLTWRDVQYIAVLAASSGSLEANDWVMNGAGKKVSHHFGFGMMDASKMVDLASNWTNIPEQHICEVVSSRQNV